MPKDSSIKKVLVIGSGPIVIGQAAEFDYAGTQACRSLKEEGVSVVLVNSNPATIMTDKRIADHVYIEPLTAEVLEQIIEKERPDSVLPTLGGQAGLNLGMELAEKVSAQTDAFVKELSRGEIIQKSLDNYGHILVAETMEDAIDAANSIASEHLEIVTVNPFEVMTKIRNAGAIFIGEYSSEPLGDYFAGPNHVLPTNGTAKFFSPLSVDDFIKKSSIISYSRNALEKIHTDIEKFAEAEHLTAHANSIKVRFEK